MAKGIRSWLFSVPNSDPLFLDVALSEFVAVLALALRLLLFDSMFRYISAK